MHYLGFAVAAVALGSLMGIAAGIWLGNAYTDLYSRYFGFPDLRHRVGWGTMLAAIAISAAAALSGAARAARSAASLPPAQAMRPPSPARYRPLLLERLGFAAPRSPSVRMILRNLERQPFRTAASSVGIALASAVLVAGMYPFNAIDRLMDVQFRQAQREELTLGFNSPLSSAVRHSLAAVDGVRRVELTRSTLVRVSIDSRRRTIVLTGLDTNAVLRVLIDAAESRYRLPGAGVVLTRSVAGVLGAGIGDTLDVTLLEKGSLRKRMVVSGVVDESIGFGGYVERSALNRLLGDGNVATGASLSVERGREDEVALRLRNMPAVSGVASRLDLLEYFERSVAESILISAGIVVFAAVVIAAGVVYNGARIALSERGRELATLRVLGFTRRECSTFFLAEQGVIITLGLPVGAVAGFGLASVLSAAFRTERYSFPVTIYPGTYVFSVLVVLAAASVVALLVRRRIDRLDMISTLKSGD
jgi:putative ABC transport system permease protein